MIRQHKKILYAILFIVSIVTSFVLNADASAVTNQHKEAIRVVLDDNYPPYSFRDSNGNLQGILVDQWKFWEQKTGTKAYLSGMDWESALWKFQKKDFDVIDTIFYNQERAKYFDFTRSYALIEVSVFFQNNISGIANAESLKGFNVGVKAGDNALNVLKENGVDSIIEYSNYDDMVEAAKEQKIVTFVMDKPSATYLMYKNNIQDKFKSTPALYYGDLSRAVHKGDTGLLSYVKSGFSMISEKEYNDINKKWFGVLPTNPIPVFQIMIAFIIVAVVVFILLLWSIALKKAVKMKTQALYETLEKYKESESSIYNMSIRDSLTGLFNRNYFEKELDRCQNEEAKDVGIVICDVDGLKLINDTLGHSIGDDCLKEAAGILKQCFNEEDVIARIGGDEFAVLIRNVDPDNISYQKIEITKIIKELNSAERIVPLSMSVGFAVESNTQMDLRELLKTADNWMYREKLHHKQSEKSNNIKILTKMLEARDFITEGHGERMQELCMKLAEAVGLPDSIIEDISLFAKFHDIGKVGIPDRILFKQGKLTDEEMDVMKRHTEIGYRIAEASSDLKLISDWILKHHEWWNGQGYLLKLKGEDIPIECRILSVVDAFDAMTNDRPYRKALTKEVAVNEIIKFKGIQFDPFLVNKFIELIK